MKKHRDGFTIVMQRLQLGAGLAELLPHIIDRPDVQRRADFATCPNDAVPL